MSVETQPFEDTSDDCSPGDSAPSADTPQPWGRLIPLTQHKNASVIQLHDDAIMFGRAGSCQHVLSDPGVSGRHCCFRKEAPPEGGGSGSIDRRKSNDYLVWVEDYSTNGTYINHEIIGKGNKRLIESGSTIDFLFKGKGKDSNISYIFQDSLKEEAMQREEGGPYTNYKVGEQLGTGTFAQVRLAVHKETGESFALKIIDKKKFSMSIATKRKNVLMDEVKILQTLKHPNIIGIKEVFETVTTLYLVLELVRGGELFDRITEKGHFSEKEARSYFKQMLEAIKYLHERGIAHRDLKPENILLKDCTSDVIKLSDFGLSRIADKGFMKTICGTPQYVAPEVLTSGKTEGYGLACDLWSAGVILFIMLAGYPPFNETKSKLSVFDQIKTADFDFADEVWDDISQSVKTLIERLLTINPKERITVEEALNHKWTLGEDDQDQLQEKEKKKKTQDEDKKETSEENGNGKGEESTTNTNNEEEEGKLHNNQNKRKVEGWNTDETNNTKKQRNERERERER